MEDLISVKEIRKLGYTLESRCSFIKGKSRYIRCSHCKAWIETKNKPDELNIIRLDCFWCQSNTGIKILK